GVLERAAQRQQRLANPPTEITSVAAVGCVLGTVGLRKSALRPECRQSQRNRNKKPPPLPHASARWPERGGGSTGRKTYSAAPCVLSRPIRAARRGPPVCPAAPDLDAQHRMELNRVACHTALAVELVEEARPGQRDPCAGPVAGENLRRLG